MAWVQVCRRYLWETCEKKLQVNSPVCAGPRCLKSRMGEGVRLSFKKPANLQVLIEKLPIKVIYTRTGSATTFAGTCGSHPSRMGVTVPRNMSPAGVRGRLRRKTGVGGFRGESELG